MTPVPFQLGRRPCFDGLRGVGSLFVVGYHMVILSGRFDAPAFGLSGIFFVLSGFLITAILVGEWRGTGRIDLRRFVARRALRLMPCLVLILAATALIYAAADLIGYDAQRLTNEDIGGRWLSIAASLTLLTNWSLAFDWLNPGPLRGTWSLAVEQQFYLIWPPILLALLWRRVNARAIAALVAGGAIGALLYREAIWQSGTSWPRVYFGSDMRVDGILVGCALGVLAVDNLLPVSERARRLLRVGAALSGVLMVVLVALLFVPVFQTINPVTDTTVRMMAPLALMSGFVLAHLIVEPDGRGAHVLSAPWLGLIGRMSYPLYLWHTFYLWFGIKLFGYGDGAVLAALALTAISVPITYYGVELPIMRLRSRRFASARAAPPKPHAAMTTHDQGADSTGPSLPPRAFRRGLALVRAPGFGALVPASALARRERRVPESRVRGSVEEGAS